jgi:cyclin A
METVQTDVNSTMRGILVDWLVEVADEYKLSSETLFLTVSYIDRCLGVCIVARTQLQVHF